MEKQQKFKELAKAKIQESRNVVISKHENGGYTMAQQLEVKEGNKTTYIFLKDAIHIDDVSNLVNLRDALNVAIDRASKCISKNEEESNWDYP